VSLCCEDLSAEAQLLLYCVRAKFRRQELPNIVSLLEHEIDWVYLVQLALQHRVVPLLYSTLNTTQSDRIPRDVLNPLRSSFRATARRNVSLTRELLKLLDQFSSRGIRAVPFKGPVWAELLYGDVTLRNFMDLDLLVSPHDLPAAMDLLRTHDYACQEDQGSERHCFRRDGLVVDLHSGVMPNPSSYPDRADGLGDNLKAASFQGREILHFCAEDFLLVLSIYATKEYRWTRLMYLVDIHALISTCPAMDWEHVLRRAKALGLERILLLALRLAADLLNTSMPHNISKLGGRYRDIDRLKSRIIKRMFLASPVPPSAPLNAVVVLYQAKLRDTAKDKLRYYLECAKYASLNEKDMIERVPAQLRWLCYGVRLVRLVVTYALPRIGELLRGPVNILYGRR
jgi:hypothetical protein